MPANVKMPVSVVIERRAATNRWDDYLWRPVGVLPPIAAERGKLLAEGDGLAQYHAGTLELELFSGETEGYFDNLSQNVPVVYVVLRRNEAGAGLEFEPFLVTVCPYEAMGYASGGDEIVEGVPMPVEVVAWVREFTERHHVVEPFRKRKNKPHQDDYGGKAAPVTREREMS